MQLPAETLMSDREVAQFSFLRLLRAEMDPVFMGDAKLERRIASEGAMYGHRERVDDEGVWCPFAPLADTFGRDLVVGTPGAGGHLVATDLSDRVIELLRAASAIGQAGADIVTGLQGNVAIPRETGGATAAWVAENTAGAESSPTIDQVQLSPKTATAYVDFSRRFLLQSSEPAERFVRRQLTRAIGTAIDQAAINGSGTANEPRGVLNTPGIGSVAGGANGAAPTWDHIVALEAALGDVNAPTERLSFVTNSKVRKKLQSTQMFGGTNGLPVWQRTEGRSWLNGLAAFVSNNVPSNLTKGTSVGVCSALIFGSWLELLVGIWGEGFDIVVDPYSFGTQGLVRVTIVIDLDVIARRPQGFAVMPDALTT
ncbi:phage major capsid protein [Betaproteobacteria bacterium PRO7]|jgi:HK97 family phage major capsid protein|nr:phage major capsid protein [Betaproteobacteria bacterium PRO7]